MQNTSENGRAKDALSVKQSKALVALIIHGSITAAAAEADCSERTLYRWLHEDKNFREAYAERRRSFVDSIIGMLQASMVEAIEVLQHAMRQGTLNHKIRAAALVLEHGLKGIEFDQIDLKEFEDVVARLEELEANQLASRERYR